MNDATLLIGYFTEAQDAHDVLRHTREQNGDKDSLPKDLLRRYEIRILLIYNETYIYMLILFYITEILWEGAIQQ